MKVKATREHEIACGHRVYGHESKCAHLHGHNYLFTFTCEADALDSVGRVIDFSVIKSTLCEWLEANWDHRFLLWQDDPACAPLTVIDPTVCIVPFNPTAENMAAFLMQEIGPKVLPAHVRLTSVGVMETRKCGAYAHQ